MLPVKDVYVFFSGTDRHLYTLQPSLKSNPVAAAPTSVLPRIEFCTELRVYLKSLAYPLPFQTRNIFSCCTHVHTVTDLLITEFQAACQTIFRFS